MKHCEICGGMAAHMHHVFQAANRPLSEKYGLVAPLCARCHRLVHAEYAESLKLKKKYQAIFEAQYSHEQWMREFMRNFL